jgi:hypothetical protein
MGKRAKKWVIIGVLLAIGVFVFTKVDRSFSIDNLSDPTSLKLRRASEQKSTEENISKQLENPPKVVKAIYSSAWSAGNSERVKYFIDLINSTELNALVVDIKDYSGVVSYKPDIEKVIEYNSFENRIADIDAFIKLMHENDIYLIARISTFQDDKLASARPDLALKSKSTGQIWGDRKDVHWMDTASREVWDYNIAIAEDILSRGFDEINFDYIRFATDGSIGDIDYPVYNEITPMHEIVGEFLAYVREKLPKAKLSADLFGLVTVNYDDLGIGQVIEDAFPYIDATAPMTYPSHYAAGFNGIANPAAHPYEVMKYSIDSALTRLDEQYQPSIVQKKVTNASGTATYIPTEGPPPVDKFAIKPTLRPWIQDFDLGADYSPAMVRAQVDAIEDSARAYSGCANLDISDACSNYVSGWMLWNASNVYSKEALKPFWQDNLNETQN